MEPVQTSCKAVVLSEFGDASKLIYSEIPAPNSPRFDEILVKVKATGVNPIEWKMREGLGPARLLGRWLLGNPMILGLDFSGVVQAVGSSVADFKIGDEIFGTVPYGGTYSEYILVRPKNRQTAIARKPSVLSHEEAGAAPFALLIAYAGLITYGGLKAGENQKVLIVGASGG